MACLMPEWNIVVLANLETSINKITFKSTEKAYKEATKVSQNNTKQKTKTKKKMKQNKTNLLLYDFFLLSEIISPLTISF